MITGQLKSKIDKLWLEFFAGGITNPLTVIEQISFLIFARLLDVQETRREKMAAKTGKNGSQRALPADRQHLRWSHFRNESGDRMIAIVRDELFPFFREEVGKRTALGKYLEGAQCLVPKASLMVTAVNLIEELPLTQGDVKGDLYEYMLGKLTTAGIAGQFPHPVVLQQISAGQPRIWVWCLALFIPDWLPHILNKGLMLWSPFTRVVADHHTSYFSVFCLVQMSLACGAILFLSNKYASALWHPQTQSRRHSFKSFLILVPLLLFHVSAWFFILPSILVLPSVPNSTELSQTLASMHQDVWGRLAYGPSLVGVVCGSIAIFVSPVLEEMLFSGLLANRLTRSYGVTVAVLSAPACFALTHMPQFGFGPQLIALFFAGLTYTIIRFYSGSLLMAVVSHMAINFVIFVPKWAVAVMHFTHI